MPRCRNSLRPLARPLGQLPYSGEHVEGVDVQVAVKL
jgi:hypothetical protein